MRIAAAVGLCFAANAQAETVTAFCAAHPTLDNPEVVFYGGKPKPGVHPKEVAALEAASIHWRCMDGRALVCDGGAADSGCWKMDPALTPNADIRDFCDDNPGSDFVSMATLGASATTWRCVGKVPTIIATQPLDARGYMKATWLPLVPHVDLPADPR